MHADRARPRRLPRHGDIGGIPTKGGDVALHPAQGFPLVQQSNVAVGGAIKEGMGHEAQHAEPIVGTHHHQPLPGQGIEPIEVGAAAHEGTPMEPHQHRQAAARRDGERPAHIHTQAILLAAGLGEVETGLLGAGGAETSPIPHPLPTRRRLGSTPALGLAGIGNAAVFVHAVAHHAAELALGRGDHRRPPRGDGFTSGLAGRQGRQTEKEHNPAH